MTPTQKIADSYRAATLKDAWYGPSLAELLAQTSPPRATTPPVPGAHSISELLQHLLLWNELVARWNQSRDLLEERLRNFPLEDLQKQVPGRSYPYETMLDGIVQHTIWHAGQIAMISSMLRSQSR